MKWTDLLRMSGNNLVRRRLRTFLTVLGVVIGTASIVVMSAPGWPRSFISGKGKRDSKGIIQDYINGRREPPAFRPSRWARKELNYYLSVCE